MSAEDQSRFARVRRAVARLAHRHHPAGVILALALSLRLAQCLTGCTPAQVKAIAPVLTRLGCELVAVLAHDETVGTLCSDLAPAVEVELQRLDAQEQTPGNLLGHRHRRHDRPVRICESLPAELAAMRDPLNGESVEPRYLPVVETVLRRQAQAAVYGDRK